MNKTNVTNEIMKYLRINGLSVNKSDWANIYDILKEHK